jgi:hypothetical protein
VTSRPTLVVVSGAAFDRVRIDAPSIEVDTSDGYRPGLEEIVAFAGGQR